MKFIIPKLMIAVVVATGIAFLSSHTAAAASTVTAWPDTKQQAIDRINTLCSQGNPVAFGVYVSSKSFDETTGVVNYSLSVLWRSCNPNAHTRAFAVTGYPDTSGSAVCPMVGWYSGGQTYDCVKYVSNPRWSSGGGLVCFSGTQQDENCVSRPAFNSIEQVSYEPSPGMQGLTLGRSGVVPNWSSRRLSDGNYTFGAGGAICAYYKTQLWNGSWNAGVGGQMCEVLAVNVSWTRPQNVYPGISATQRAIAPGETAQMDAFVQNLGGRTQGFVPYTVYEIVSKNGVQPDYNQFNQSKDVGNQILRYLQGAPYSINGQQGCDWFKQNIYNNQPGVDCRPATANNDTTDFASGYTQLSNAVYDGNNYSVGDTVCRFTAIRRFDSSHTGNDPTRRISAPACVVIGKKPTVHVWGGDVATRGMINTSIANKTDGIFGSWVEYGAFSAGPNNRFASGAGLLGQHDPNQSGWSQLTFANTNASCGGASFGCYAPSTSFRPLPRIAEYFNSLPTQPYDASAFANNTFTTGSTVAVRDAGATVALGGITLQPRQSAVIVADTVTITGNISYQDATYTSANQLPQLVILAKNINIQDNVTNIDAWLIASGTVNTCANVAGNLTINLCNQQLTVHGPVSADSLLLRRTAGAGDGPASGDPAEVFDLRADAYLWAEQLAQGGNKARTVYSTELPPRF